MALSGAMGYRRAGPGGYQRSALISLSAWRRLEESARAAARQLELLAGNFQLADGLAVGQGDELDDVAVRAERCRGFRDDRHRVQVSAARLGADDARGDGEPVDPHLL